MKMGNVALVAAAGLALAGCGGSSEGAEDSPPVEVVEQDVPDVRPAANPVKLAKKIPDCVLPKGATSGDTGGDGERTVTCDVLAPGETGAVEEGASATSVEVTTLPTPRPAGWEVADMASEDSNKVVVGKGFVITITGRAGGEFDVKPADVAAAVGGRVLPPLP